MSSNENKSIDIEGNGVFLSYQILFLLISGLIGLGITISVWNSYKIDIDDNTKELERLEKYINEKYKDLDNKILKSNIEYSKKLEERYKMIKEDTEKNNERYKDWLKKLSEDNEKNKESILHLKYKK